MKTVCMHCALVAFVKQDGIPIRVVDPNEKLPDEIFGVFNESPWEHNRRAHPQGIDPAERMKLEQQAAMIIRRTEGMLELAMNTPPRGMH